MPLRNSSVPDDDPDPDPLTLIQAASERAPIRTPTRGAPYRRSAPTLPEKALGVLVGIYFALGVVAAIWCFIWAAKSEEMAETLGGLWPRWMTWFCLLAGVVNIAAGIFAGAFAWGAKLALEYLRRTADATEHMLLNRPR